jgi:hypothetical protein
MTAPDTAIGRLVKHLVLVLICVDLCYHIPDLVFAMDNDVRAGPAAAEGWCVACFALPPFLSSRHGMTNNPASSSSSSSSSFPPLYATPSQAPPLFFMLRDIVHDSHRIHMDELTPTIYYVLVREVREKKRGGTTHYGTSAGGTTLRLASLHTCLPTSTHPHTHTVACLQGLGVMSVFWHGTIAYCMYCWIVLKHSASRLRRRRLPDQVCTVRSFVVRPFVSNRTVPNAKPSQAKPLQFKPLRATLLPDSLTPSLSPPTGRVRAVPDSRALPPRPHQLQDGPAFGRRGL